MYKNMVRRRNMDNPQVHNVSCARNLGFFAVCRGQEKCEHMYRHKRVKKWFCEKACSTILPSLSLPQHLQAYHVPEKKIAKNGEKNKNLSTEARLASWIWIVLMRPKRNAQHENENMSENARLWRRKIPLRYIEVLLFTVRKQPT